jgi:hypothetical protein
MKTILRTLVLGPIIAISLTSYSQDSLHEKLPLHGGFGHFNFSWEQINLNELNTALAANGFNKLSSTSISYGGGGGFCANNFIFSGVGSWLAGSGVQNADLSVDIKGGYGYFSAGYICFSGKRSVFYPSLIFGGGGYSLMISKEGNHNFPEQLNTPQDMVTAEAGGWITGVQVAYQYFLNRNGKQGWYIGLEAGYKYSPHTWEVTVNDTKLASSPKINMNGLYLTLVFGGGSLTNK